MSYSVCKSGGKMCDGCMACYDDRYEEELDEESEDEEEEEIDD